MLRSTWRGLETWHGRDAVTPRNRKGEATGNTNIDLNWRASPRPYLGAPGGEIPPGDSTTRGMVVASSARQKHLNYRTESLRRRTASPLCQFLTHAAQQTRSYSITSSARTSREVGSSTLIDFAVLRFMTSSNREGSKTGKSEGLSPLRIRPA